MNLRALTELEVSQRIVLVRTGFDVQPHEGGGQYRIRSSLPTLEYLVKKKSKIVILSHLGRPRGRDLALSLGPVAQQLAELWGRKFVAIPDNSLTLPEYAIPHLYFFAHDLEKQDVRGLIDQMRPGDAAVLENLRFYPGEERNDEIFVKTLAALGEVYVNDAFSVCHRAHASVVGLAEAMPAAAGLQLQKEVQALSAVLHHPKKPVVVMMGGVKLSDKAAALTHLAKFADAVLLGGGLANLFLKMRGFAIGKSVYEEDRSQETLAKELLRDYPEKIHLPLDLITSRSREGEPECVKPEKVKGGEMILDIGPATIREYSRILKQGQTLIWGGPLGYFENPSFSHGTFALAWLFASRGKSNKAFSVAGGGETLAVIEKLGLLDRIDLVSTGGGAMLEFLAGTPLLGLKVLQK